MTCHELGYHDFFCGNEQPKNQNENREPVATFMCVCNSASYLFILNSMSSSTFQKRSKYILDDSFFKNMVDSINLTFLKLNKKYINELMARLFFVVRVVVS